VRRALLALLAVVAAGLGIALLVAQPAAERAFFAAGPRGTWVMAHRGGRGLRPENTLAAFEHAAALGVDVLEMDVRATADGEIVVIHDATVERTTGGQGAVAAWRNCAGSTRATAGRATAGGRFRIAARASGCRRSPRSSRAFRAGA